MASWRGIKVAVKKLEEEVTADEDKVRVPYDGDSVPFHIVLLHFWCPFALVQEGFQRWASLASEDTASKCGSIFGCCNSKYSNDDRNGIFTQGCSPILITSFLFELWFDELKRLMISKSWMADTHILYIPLGLCVISILFIYPGKSSWWGASRCTLFPTLFRRLDLISQYLFNIWNLNLYGVSKFLTKKVFVSWIAVFSFSKFSWIFCFSIGEIDVPWLIKIFASLQMRKCTEFLLS